MSSTSHHRPKEDRDDVGDFDYIIVGAGTAGCVLACRLAASGRNTVLLLEAGDHNRSARVRTPGSYRKLFDDPTLNWCFEGAPEPHLYGRTLFHPRGKVVGGSSSINAMLYTRGLAGDFARWEEMGCRGWGHADTLPFFEAVERQLDGGSELGQEGVVPVSRCLQGQELADSFLLASGEAGHRILKSFNGGSNEGASYFHVTARHGTRCSAASTYLRQVGGQSNLRVMVKANVSGIHVSGRRADSVLFEQDGRKKIAGARCEIVLSAGVFGSPHILLLSGFGPSEDLKQMNIHPVCDLKSVGHNLQDHFTVSLIFRCSRKITLNDQLNGPVRKAIASLKYLTGRNGPYSQTGVNAAVHLRTGQEFDSPNIQLNLVQWSVSNTGRLRSRLDDFSGFSIGIAGYRPTSRGTVRLRTPSHREPPEITNNFLATDEDRFGMIGGIRAARKIAAMPSMRRLISTEIAPGDACSTDAQLLEDCRPTWPLCASSRRNLPNGRRCRSGSGQPVARTWNRRTSGRRWFGYALAGFRKPCRDNLHDRRKRRGHDP